jgi:hypothetical protein
MLYVSQRGYMKKYYPALIAFLMSFFAYAESVKFEYSSFYQKLTETSIRSSFLKFCPKEISNDPASYGSSSFNFGKGFHFIHTADVEVEKKLLLAYGDGIAMSLRFGGFSVGAINNPRYDKDSKPLSYTIFGNNKTNICDVVIYSHRLSDDTVKIEAVFREYAMKK